MKPANLFLTKSADGSPLIKVLDFGISKVDGMDDGAATSSAVIVGSPFYMSPEQMISTKDVDVRTDIWALGIILFQLVSGRLPFREESIPALTLKLHTERAPHLRVSLPDAPLLLDQVVSRCLTKDRAARFPTVGALARALSPLAGATALAPWRPFKLPLVAIIGGGAALMLGAGLLTVAATRRPGPEVVADSAALTVPSAGALAAPVSAAPSVAPSPVVTPASAAPQASSAPAAAAPPATSVSASAKKAGTPPRPATKKPREALDPFGTGRR